MPRIRSIYPEACTSEKLALLTGDEERCYWRLQTHCDDAGRCEDNVRLIWAALFPLHETVTSRDVDVWLNGLEKAALIVRYEVGGRAYLCIAGFAEKQKPRHPTPSKLPPMPEGCGEAPEGYGVPPHVVVGVDVDVDGGRRQRPTKDFQPTPEHLAFGAKNGLNVQSECDHWIEHCEAKGVRYVKLNSGFSTWLRNAVNFGRGKPPSTGYDPDAMSRSGQ